MWVRTGRLTATANGLGKTITDGLGLTRRPGAGLLIITAGGSGMAATTGVGGPDRPGSFGRGVRLWWDSLVRALGWDGWRLRRTRAFRHGGDGGVGLGSNRYPTSGVRFQNAAVRGAALFVGRDNFSGPHGRFGSATPEQLRSATRFDGHVPITPNRSSYRFSDRTFVTNRGGRVVTPASRQTGFSVAPRSSYSRSTPSGLSNGWQRFGDPGVQRNYERGSFTAAPRGESGWHQFGRPPSQQPSEAGRSSANRSYRSYETPRLQAAPSVAPAPGSGTSWRSFSTRPGGQSWSGTGSRSNSGESRYNAPAAQYQRTPAASQAPRYTQPSQSFRNSGGESRQPARSMSSGGGGSHGNSGEADRAVAEVGRIDDLVVREEVDIIYVIGQMNVA